LSATSRGVDEIHRRFSGQEPPLAAEVASFWRRAKAGKWLMPGQERDTPPRRRQQVIPYPFAPVPIDIISDANISDGAFRALAVMIGIRDGDQCCISEKRLGVRLHRSKRTAHAYVHELISAGIIKPMDAQNGHCGTYRIVALTGEAHYTGSSRLQGKTMKKPTRTDAIPFTATDANGFSHPRPVDIPLENDNTQRNENERSLRDRFLSELKRCDLNGSTPEKEADRLIQRFPGTLFSLFCHLRYALEAKIENPVKYAEHEMERGKTPRPIRDIIATLVEQRKGRDIATPDRPIETSN
jgi:hypothetical protein